MANVVEIALKVTGNAAREFKKLRTSANKFATDFIKRITPSQRAFDNFIANVASDAARGAFNSLTNAAKNLFNTIITDGVRAAIVQEDAINQLNIALQNAGQFSEEASLGIQAFASALQQQTTVGDEAILQGVALAQTYVKTSEEAKELTKTALDFAEAADLSFTEAIRRLGRGVQGSAGDLANFSPEIRKLTKEQLAAGDATRLIAAEFRGAAAAATKTFSGATRQLGNIFGDFTEEVGFAITQNPQIIALFKELGQVLIELAGSVKENRGAFAVFVDTSLRLTAVFLDGISVLKDTVNLALDSIGAAVAFLAGGFVQLINTFIKAFDALASVIPGVDNPLKGITDTLDDLGESLVETSAELGNSALNVGLGKDAFESFADGIRDATDATRDLNTVTKETTNDAIKGEAESLLLREVQDEQARAKKFEGETQLADSLITFLQERNKQLAALDMEGDNAEILRNRERINTIISQEKVSTKKLVELQKEKNERIAKADKESKDEGLNRESEFNQALAAVARTQQSKIKAIIILGKAAAIAQITIDTAVSAARAFRGLSFFPPLAVAAAAAVIAFGAERIAKVSGVNLQEGITRVPQGFPNDTFPAQLSSGERVVSAQQNQDLTAFLESNQGIENKLDVLIDVVASQQRQTIVNIGGDEVINTLQDELDSGRALEL